MQCDSFKSLQERDRLELMQMLSFSMPLQLGNGGRSYTKSRRMILE